MIIMLSVRWRHYWRINFCTKILWNGVIEWNRRLLMERTDPQLRRIHVGVVMRVFYNWIILTLFIPMEIEDPMNIPLKTLLIRLLSTSATTPLTTLPCQDSGGRNDIINSSYNLIHSCMHICSTYTNQSNKYISMFMFTRMHHMS